MQANLSFILNIVFLGIILSMIFWKMRPYLSSKKSVKKESSQVKSSPTIAMDDYEQDDVINVRKLDIKDYLHQEESIEQAPTSEESKPSLGVSVAIHANETEVKPSDDIQNHKKNIMVFLAAQGQSTFAGYDLLQTLLSCGLRYGDAGLFHRHQHASGQGPVLFSLAAATATGMFDLQNMGAMSVKGLCIFMELSGNIAIDSERFEIFMQTAKQLAEDLHANLLDERQRPLTQDIIKKFEHMIAETTEL